jgi:fatty-acyl-CoA synthase
VVALLNTNLVGPSLAHCINIVLPKHLIVAREFLDPLTSALPGLNESPAIWTYGIEHTSFRRIDFDVDRKPREMLGRDERRAPTIEDRALYIFTSGTTGLQKAANISHARVLQWTHWFVGMMGVQPADRMYN